MTYQHDATRHGAVVDGPDPGSVGSTWISKSLDGDVYAQPLVFDGKIIVATENNSVYALNESSGSLVWHTHFGEPIAQAQLPCGNIDPTGITGTPVISPQDNAVYAVAFEQPGRHILLAMDLDDGTGLWSRSADDASMDPLVQQQRPALLLDAGRVYIAYGGLFGDCGDYHGWVTSISANGRGPLTSFQVPSGNAAGIWSPAGPSADGKGSIYVATGNSFSTTDFDFGNAVIALDRTLHRRDFFAPEDWAELNDGDVDIGSTAPLLLPGGLIFQIGKSGVGYILGARNLGGIGGDVFHDDVCPGGAYGASAFATSTIFVACTDGLVALHLNDDGSFEREWEASGFFAGPPVIGGNTVWTVNRDGSLEAFDISDGRREFEQSLGTVSNFGAPSITDSCVFAAADKKVHALCEP